MIKVCYTDFSQSGILREALFGVNKNKNKLMLPQKL